MEGYSYSQIKKELGVSKSTLSAWLKYYPLSDERIAELTSKNHQRIENYIKTRRAQKEKILKEFYDREKSAIFPLSKRDLFIAGLFLYWGEGGKTKESELVFSNTNPAMVKFFIKWLELLGVSKKDLKVKLHLYSDMNISKSIIFWANELKIPVSQFKRPYIKETKLTSITYKNGFGKGTCCVIFEDRDLWEYIIMGLKYISDGQNIHP